MEVWMFDTAEIEGWVSQDLLTTCTSGEHVPELDFCQIGMTAIVMGDVNAVYPLECAHRRQLLAARALNERSLLIRGLHFPRPKTIGDVYIDDLVILSVLQFSDVHVDSSPNEVQRADASYNFLQMSTNAGKSGSTLAGEFLGGRRDWRCRHDRVPSRTPSIAHAHHDAGRCCGRKSDALAAPSGRWAFALSDEKNSPASMCLTLQQLLAVQQTMSSETELVLVTGLAPLLETNLRAEPRKTPRYGWIFQRWRRRRAHRTGGLAHLVRVGRGKSGKRATGLERAKNHQAARWTRSRCASWALQLPPGPFFPRRAHPLGLGEPDQPLEAGYT